VKVRAVPISLCRHGTRCGEGVKSYPSENQIKMPLTTS
jgi:hypothetical protein